MWKDFVLGTLLVVIAVMGPMVAFAGVTVIYPKSNVSLAVSTTPPITFLQGTDYNQAANLTVASGWAGSNNNASFSLTFNGLSGANLTVDNLVNVTATGFVSSFKLQVAQNPWGSSLNSSVSTLKVRAWQGGTAPTADGSSGVCAVLDLTAANDTESSASCNGSGKLQFVMNLNDGASGTATIQIRPSSILFI